jgi:hypothetical protein
MYKTLCEHGHWYFSVYQDCAPHDNPAWGEWKHLLPEQKRKKAERAFFKLSKSRYSPRVAFISWCPIDGLRLLGTAFPEPEQDVMCNGESGPLKPAFTAIVKAITACALAALSDKETIL